jgi:hypothetical protein
MPHQTWLVPGVGGRTKWKITVPTVYSATPTVAIKIDQKYKPENFLNVM